MVYQQTQPGEIKEKRKHGKVANALFDIFVMLIVGVATFALFRFTIVRPENQEKNNPEVVNKIPTDDENSRWLQQTINMWFANYQESVRVGMMIYDLDNNSVLGEIKGDEVFTEQPDSDLGSRVNKGFTTTGQTTAREIADIAKAVYLHEGMSEEDYSNLKNEFAISSEDEQKTGLSAGFKSGKCFGENYSRQKEDTLFDNRDIVLLEFQTDDGQIRNYAVALIAENFSGQEEFEKLGAAIEESIIGHFDEE